MPPVMKLASPSSPTPQCCQPVTLPLGIDRGFHALEGERAEHAVGDVLLARPNELDRPLDVARDMRRLEPRSRRANGGQSHRRDNTGELDLIRLEAKRLGDQIADAADVLRAVPDFELVAGLVEAGDRVQRLHLGVIAVVAADTPCL